MWNSAVPVKIATTMILTVMSSIPMRPQRQMIALRSNSQRRLPFATIVEPRPRHHRFRLRKKPLAFGLLVSVEVAFHRQYALFRHRPSQIDRHSTHHRASTMTKQEGLAEIP